jgi:hypothetical protein
VAVAVNPIQRAPASTAWLAVGAAAHVAMAVAEVVVAAMAAATVAVAVVVVAVAVAAMVAATAAVVRSVADQQRVNIPLAIGPSMVGNGPIIEFHFSAAQFAVLGHPAPHSGAPHFERAGRQFSAHDFDHTGFGHARSFVNRFKRGSIFPSHLNDGRNVSGA